MATETMTVFVVVLAILCLKYPVGAEDFATPSGPTKDMRLSEFGPEIECRDFEADLVKRKQENEERLATFKAAQEAFDYNQSDYTDFEDYDYEDEISYSITRNEAASIVPSQRDQEQVALAFNPLSVEENVDNANKNPDLLLYLTDCQLNYVLTWEPVIRMLEVDTFAMIMKSANITNRIADTIPYKTVAQMLTIRPDLVDIIPRSQSGRDFAQNLLSNPVFVGLVNVSMHADFAESEAFQKILTPVIMLEVLKVYPDLPQHLGPRGLEYGSSLLMRSEFLDKVDCPVLECAVQNFTFLRRLDMAVIKAFGENEHFWRCLSESQRHTLLNDDRYLRMIPADVHAGFVESLFFQTLLDSEIVRKVLHIYPDLPPKLGPRGLAFGSIMLSRQDFLNSLDCSVFRTSVQNSSFVNRLPSSVMKAFSENGHFWSCLPIDMVETMMRTTNVARKLSFRDVLSASLVMARARRIDKAIVFNIFRIQVPQFLRETESNYYDAFNMFKNNKKRRHLRD